MLVVLRDLAAEKGEEVSVLYGGVCGRVFWALVLGVWWDGMGWLACSVLFRWGVRGWCKGVLVLVLDGKEGEGLEGDVFFEWWLGVMEGDVFAGFPHLGDRHDLEVKGTKDG